MEQRVPAQRSHRPAIGDVPVTKWRVERSRRVTEKGSTTIFSTRGREDPRGQLAAMRKLAWRLGWLDRSVDPQLHGSGTRECGAGATSHGLAGEECTLTDVRHRPNVGADAVDDRERYYELKVHQGAIPDTVKYGEQLSHTLD
jgi:hypothetical protein